MRGCHAADSADDEHDNGDDDVECGHTSTVKS